MMGWTLFGVLLGVVILGSWVFHRRVQTRVKDLETDHRSTLSLLAVEGEKRVDRIQRESLREQSDVEHQMFLELLPTLDALDAALREPDLADPQAVIDGVSHIRDALMSVLKHRGGTRIEPETGAPFEPSIHEAAALIPDVDAGTVGECLRAGYRQGAHVLRPAMVSVGERVAAKADELPPEEALEDRGVSEVMDKS